MNTRAFLEAIRTETLGFTIGDPWRPEDKSITCVTPIIRKSDEEPTYLVSVQAKDLKIVDTGSINQATVKSLADKPVFIRAGELLKGDTQNRTFVQSLIIAPKEEKSVEVRCVHASHGITSGAEFKSNGYSPGKDHVYYMSSHGGYSVSQQASWNSDRSYVSAVAGRAEGSYLPDPDLFQFTQSHTDDLTSVRDKYNDLMRDVLAKVPLLDNQVGVTIIDTKGVYVIECYNLHAPWKAVKEAFVGKESLSITERNEAGVFSFNPEKSKGAIQELLGAGFEEKTAYSNGYQVVILTWDNHIGEATIFGDSLIHLGITRKE